MANENGNGTLAKLVSLRQDFLTGVNEVRVQFVARIKTLREDYLNQVVDATMSDPKLGDVEKALSSWNTQPVTIAPPPVESATAGSVPIGQGPPEKFPMKMKRDGLTVYGRCPSCNSYILEPDARFCSRCAYPLDEAFPSDPTTCNLAKRATKTIR